jgi:cobalt-zinc-cadmium efflux system outer membrane protein
MNLFKTLLCICTIFINFLSWSESYAYEPHTSEDHKYEGSIYSNNQKITLQDAIDLAMKFSPELKASEAQVMAARGSERQAGYWNNPELEIEAENISGTGPYTDSNLAEYTYSLTKSIDISGKRSARKKVASSARKAANDEVIISQLSIIRNVHIAYAEVLSEAEALKLAKEQEKLAKQVLRTVTKRVSAARESEIQKIKATVAYENSLIASNQKQQQLQSAKQKLAILIGKKELGVSLDHSHFFDLEAPKPIDSYKKMLSHSPISRKSQHLSDEKEYAYDFEKAHRVSDPKVKIGIREFRENNEQALVAGLSIPFPIFNWNQGNVSRAKAELDQAQNNQLNTKLSLEQNLIEEWQNWQISYATAEKLKNTILPTAEKAFKVARSGYQKGKFPYLEVLDTQRTLFESREKYHVALKQYHIARANIELIVTPLNNNQKGNNNE